MTNIVDYVLNLRGNLSQGLSAATAQTTQLEGALAGARGMAVSLGGALGIAFGVAGIVAFTTKVVQAGSTVESATIGLTTLLKDSAEAAQVVNNTMEDATKTPFAFEGLLAANKAIISAGVGSQKAREDVLNLANAIASTGGGDDELKRMVVNMQQISNTGRATAMDIKQFGYAGINIYKVLADATGQSIDKVKEMPVTYDMLTMALKKAGAEGGIYANGLENMAQSTSVRISNIGDSLFQMFNDIFVQTKPIIDVVLTSTLSSLKTISVMAIDAIKWIKENKNVIMTLAGAYVLYKGILITTTAVQALQASMALQQALAGVTLTTAQSLAAVATSALSTAVWALNAAWAANPIGIVIAGIAALVAGVLWAWNTFEGFRKAVLIVWEVLKAFGIGVGGVFMGLGEVIAGALTLNPELIKKGLKDTISAVKDAATQIGEAGEKGSEAGAKSWWREKGTKANAGLIPKNSKAGIVGMTGEAGANAPSPKTKAEGQKSINIHVAYNAPLIKDFTISTTNIKEGFESLKEQVSAILVGATHDTLMVADY